MTQQSLIEQSKRNSDPNAPVWDQKLLTENFDNQITGYTISDFLRKRYRDGLPLNSEQIRYLEYFGDIPIPRPKNPNSENSENSEAPKNEKKQESAMNLSQEEYFKKFFWTALFKIKSVRKTLFALTQSYLESGGLSPNGIWRTTNNLFGITKNTGGFRSYDSFADSFEDWDKFMTALYNKYINAPNIELFSQVAYSPYITNKDGREQYRQNLLRIYANFKSIYRKKLVKWLAIIVLPTVILIPVLIYSFRKTK